MAHYVRIPRLNGRKDFYDLALKLDERGYDRVEYNPGGWADTEIHNVDPHLKFFREDDALAYVLAYGGELGAVIPTTVQRERQLVDNLKLLY